MNLTEEPENIDEILRLWRIEDASLEFSLYNFSQIADATDDFSPKNILGEGGFGPVYKVFPCYNAIIMSCTMHQFMKNLYSSIYNEFCRDYFLMDKR